MTEQEENELFTLSLFKNDFLSFQEIHNYHLRGEEDLYENINATTHGLMGNGYARKESRNSQESAVITDKGKKYYERLKQKKSEEEIDKIHFEDEKILVRQIQQSTLDTNKSVRRLNRTQKPILIIGVIIATLTLWVINEQRNILKKQDDRDNQLSQKQQELERMQHTLQIMQQSLDSMRDLQNADTAKSKNDSVVAGSPYSK